jgi:histidinol-phosphate aminotransferase
VARRLTMAAPSFEAIAIYAGASGREVVNVPLDRSYAHDLEKMTGTDLVYICNPNNPTATITPKERLREFIEKTPPSTIVLVDEAYHHYAESPQYESVIPLVHGHPNLVVARTFSKIYAMAGLRCGYAVADEKVIEAMGRHQQWDAMNVMAMVAAQASLGDQEHVARGRKRNRDTRGWVVAQLKDAGYECLPSEANFVMADLRRPVKPLLGALSSRGVRVGRLFPAMPDFMRVTIGTHEEMKRFIDAFRDVVNA